MANARVLILVPILCCLGTWAVEAECQATKVGGAVQLGTLALREVRGGVFPEVGAELTLSGLTVGASVLYAEEHFVLMPTLKARVWSRPNGALGYVSVASVGAVPTVSLGCEGPLHGRSRFYFEAGLPFWLGPEPHLVPLLAVRTGVRLRF